MKRQSNESYTDYKARREVENTRIDAYLKGRFVWLSSRLDEHKKRHKLQGTYRKPR